MPDLDIVTQVQSLSRKGEYVEAEIAALGPIKLESGMRTRARGRALMAAGVLPTTYETIVDIPMGEINRLTEVKSERPGEDVEIDAVPVLDKLLQTKVYTIHVNRE